ncbi:MAG: hypothetical protein FJW34_11540 [Acidobacteria bacterium]|nr:hypothetical protein [Acidobacteriota bacterium]
MRALLWIVPLWLGWAPIGSAQDTAGEARRLERAGDPLAARLLLQRAARNSPESIEAQTAYAEFLDRYGDPETRPAYEKLLALLKGPSEGEARARTALRLATLALIEGDRAAAGRHLAECRLTGGALCPAALPAPPAAPLEQPQFIQIPGPLSSFLRMAAVSQDVSPADLLPALARNVVTNGYHASTGGEALEPTEYMKLLTRYLSQARELTRLAGREQVVKVEACESPQTGELLRVLGYRMRGSCGSELVLETVNATRAFLTIDSGFPLADLEQALRTSRPFTHDYQPVRVPVLYGPDYWLTAREKQAAEFIDVFLGDPLLGRFYLGMSKLDRETADELKQAVTAQRLKAFAHVLDFYGGMFAIRGGKVSAPGGARSAAMWSDLVGVSPDQGAAFFERLIARDDGWMASFYDALARIEGPVKDYLTEPARMKRFYMAVRGRVTSPGPARPVFRANSDMMLLTTRLRLEGDGRPHIPGGVEVWKNLFIRHPHGRYDGRLTRLATTWKEPDDVLEALFALCRKAVENEPLKMFMALSDLNRNRPQPLEAATVDRLARDYRQFSAQYPIFAEAPLVRDQTLLQYLDAAQSINRMGDLRLRSDTAGMMQALTGLWQIFSRQGSIRPEDADPALSGILAEFSSVRNHRGLFDGGRTGVRLLIKATRSAENAPPQDRLIDLLAGGDRPGPSEWRNRLIEEMIRIFEAQRLLSLNLLFELSDHLESLARGERLNTALVNRLAARMGEIQLPRTSLTGPEKNAFAFGYWTERHLEAQRRLNLRASIDRAANDAERLGEVRGQLAPFLRDALVGLNYVHYAPPGAQLLLTNPLFVRSHDFLGMQGNTQTWRMTEVLGTGWPSSGGGRLIGSLAGLPYALAEAEQNFMVPTREQALIWGDLVPQMILSAKIPRWWSVTPAQLHWVGLHMRYAETLLAQGALEARRRQEVTEILERQSAPARAWQVARLLEHGEVHTALERTTPAEMFALAAETLRRERTAGGPLAAEIRRLEQEFPEQVSHAAISRTFGTPKPTLTNSYRPELLLLRTFPTLMGYSSRIMAESWESPLLYWAALADAVHVPPAQLNVLIPELTQKTMERIFATHLEDWPALLRSLRLVGEDFRLKQRVQMEAEQKAAL